MPHMKTLRIGSFARNNLTFWCFTRNRFFFIILGIDDDPDDIVLGCYAYVCLCYLLVQLFPRKILSSGCRMSRQYCLDSIRYSRIRQCTAHSHNINGMLDPLCVLHRKKENPIIGIETIVLCLCSRLDIIQCLCNKKPSSRHILIVCCLEAKPNEWFLILILFCDRCVILN